MLPNLTEYHKPNDVQEALRLLRRRNIKTAPLAGGSGLLAQRDASIQAVVDLRGLGLDAVQSGPQGIRLGATATLQAVAETLADSAGAAERLLSEAAHHSATRPLRNVATVGGAIASCGRSTDLVTALLALDAQLTSPAGDSLALADFLAAGKALPRSWGFIAGVRVAAEASPPGLGAVLERVSRLPTDTAIVNVAAAVAMAGGLCTHMCLAAGGVAGLPLRLRAAEAVLLGTDLSAEVLAGAAQAEVAALKPEGDILGSGEYRLALLSVLLGRAVQGARR